MHPIFWLLSLAFVHGCIMFLDERTPDEIVPRDWFDRCFTRHPHGVGIMYPKEGKLFTWRHLNDVDKLYALYLEAKAIGGPVAVHFRRGTSGADLCDENVHPFDIIPGKLAVMHNGTITAIPLKLLPGNLSDTRFMVEDVFKKLPPDFLTHEIFQIMIDKLLGFDRMLFMDADGHSLIFNPKGMGGYYVKGAKDGDTIWWSHDKDRTFIEKGKEIQYSSTGWYDENQVWHPYGTGKLTKTRDQAKDQLLKNSTDPHYYYFNYGIFDDHTLKELGAVRCEPGQYLYHPLYALHTVEDKEVEPAVFMSNPSSARGTTYGTVWSVPATGLDALADGLKGAGSRYWEVTEEISFVRKSKKGNEIRQNVVMHFHYSASNTPTKFDLTQLEHVTTGVWESFKTEWLERVTKPFNPAKALAKATSTIKEAAQTPTHPISTPAPRTTPKPEVASTPSSTLASATGASEAHQSALPFPKVHGIQAHPTADGGASAFGVAAIRIWDGPKPTCSWCKSDHATSTWLTTQSNAEIARGVRYVWCGSCEIEMTPAECGIIDDGPKAMRQTYLRPGGVDPHGNSIDGNEYKRAGFHSKANEGAGARKKSHPMDNDPFWNEN